MFNITDCNFAALQSGPSSAPPNPQTSSQNHFAFPSYFAQPLTFYSQLNQQLNGYASVPSPATINNLTHSFQQQQFNSPTNYGTSATTPIQTPANTHFFNPQPSTSVQPVYSNDMLTNFQQNWTQPTAWPPNLNTQSTVSPFYDFNPTLFNSNDAFQQFIHNDLPPQPSVASNPFWVPKNALDRTVVLIQRQNQYTLAWTEKTSKIYFRKWFDTTFSINVDNVDCKIIHKPDFIIGFFALDTNTATHLINVFADGQLKNDVLLKGAADFLIQSMSIHKQRQGSTSAINSVDEAVNCLSEVKQFKLLPMQEGPMSAPPYPYKNPFGQSS